MTTASIDGKKYIQMLLGGASVLAEHTQELNSLNVFPVADGDTGTNMSHTLTGGINALTQDGIVSIGAMAKLFARGVLLSARGNSGVILSQIFAGITEKLEQYDTVGAKELAQAYYNGIQKSYAAVQNPTEGTILTVFRESTEYAASHLQEDSSVEDFFQLHLEQAQRSLAQTKEKLAVLAEADVVDSGAAGYLYIVQGMYQALTGQKTVETIPQTENAQKPQVDIDRFTRDSVLEFGYCTEVLLRLTTSKVDPDNFALQTVLDALQELGGESVVAFQQEDIVKVHVHTFTPGKILDRLQCYGEFLTLKIENMSLGHSGEQAEKPKVKQPFAVVTVATGEGLTEKFRALGAQVVISGGQTANPSIAEFVEAFKSCCAENIIVLPNNKNIILAAQQAANVYTDAKVHIVETKNLMQGISALSVITPGLTDMEVLLASAQRAAMGVEGYEVTKAVRDATVGGKTVCQGEYMAISGGEMVATGKTPEETAVNMLRAADMDLAEIITVYAGCDASADSARELTEQLQELFSDCEVCLEQGDQMVYDYLVAVE